MQSKHFDSAQESAQLIQVNKVLKSVGSFDTVPRELEEAALLDGCTSFSLLYRVMLSLVRPGIITVGIYAFLNSWNEFLAARYSGSDDDGLGMILVPRKKRSLRCAG